MQENLLDLAAHKLGHALQRLEQDIAGKAVAHRDVALAERHAAALDVAYEVDAPRIARRLEQRVGLAAQRVALGVLGAVVDQADARLFQPRHALHIQAAHKGELQQVFRRALGIRARVHQHDLPATARHHRRERRAADALDAPAVQGCAGKQRAGVARGNDRVTLALFQHFQRDGHRGFRLVPQDGRRVVVHIHCVWRVDDGQLAAGQRAVPAALPQDAVDGILVADQDNLLLEGLRSHGRAGDRGQRRVVAAHRVKDDLHVKFPPLGCRSRRAPARQSPCFSPFCP